MKHSKLTYIYISLTILSFIFVSCNTTRYVPDGQYLLDKTKMTLDNKQLDKDDLTNYLRQKQNTTIFGFWKLQLDIYNISGNDSTKWINMAIKAMGEQPEILDTALTQFSEQQLTQALHNKGFFDAQVSSQTTTKQKKAKVQYDIVAGQPYTLNNYTINLENDELTEIANSPRKNIEPGINFDADVFNAERQRIANSMRYRGYYLFDTDFLYYEADSTAADHKIDAELTLRDYIANMPDSLKQRIFTKYKVRKVIFEMENDENDTNQAKDTAYYNQYVFIGQNKGFIRHSVLIRNCHIIPQTYYNSLLVDLTASSLNALSAVKYASINFKYVGNDELDCVIRLSKSKSHTITAEVEGTYSAGDWGVAGQLGYAHKNIFHGSEELNITGRGAYEWRQTGGTAMDWNVKASLSFPNLVLFINKNQQRRVNTITNFSVQYNYQNRPDEYTRTILASTIKNTWTPISGRWNQSFAFFDLSYIYLPTISDNFRRQFLTSNNILRYSYEDHFILDWNYSGNFSTYRVSQPLKNYVTLTYSLETAGNLLYGIAAAARLSKTDDDNSYKMFSIRFSQYVKGDFSVSFNHIWNKNHRIVYHAGVGIAYPYGNSQSIPFEKRYFSGGANSVRGWQARALGPGTFSNTSGSIIDFNNQAGDIKLDLNIEYRFKLIWRLEGALFTDAGNIWTIKEYPTQPGGLFKFNEFYKQIAWSYGLGLRLDFSVFVFRVDCGIKLYDPSRIASGTQWRQPNWRDDVTFHFAIGYPF